MIAMITIPPYLAFTDGFIIGFIMMYIVHWRLMKVNNNGNKQPERYR